MTSVKTRDRHAAVLLNDLLDQIRAVFARGNWGGLRTSHFRVLSMIAVAGSTVTELAERVGMTKQAAGQFVTTLVEAELVAVDGDPDDRRVRIARRTGHGDAVVADVQRQIAAVEDEWAALVGPRRYATFRAVLTEIADRGAAGSVPARPEPQES